jgi:peptidoglycan/xylan/chitin deacetylase (PgdA/CDA1 family)
MMLRMVLTAASHGRLSILIFHRILEEPDPLLLFEPCARQFDEILAHVKRQFNVLPLREAVVRLKARTLPSRAFCLTFDDGYADNLTVAAPLLVKHSLPATVFVATGYLGKSMWNDRVIEAIRATRKPELDLACVGLQRYKLSSLDDRRNLIDLVLKSIRYLPFSEREQRVQDVIDIAETAPTPSRMLTEASLRDLAGLGIDIGAHTVTHPILARTAAREAWSEIIESKQHLEKLLSRPIDLFAYPNGRPNTDYSREHVRMVREAGFAAAVTTAYGAAGASTDHFQLPRFAPWSYHPTKFDLLALRNVRQAASVAMEAA